MRGRSSLSPATKWSLALLASVAPLSFSSTEARAQKPTSQVTEYSRYEREAIEIALKDLNLELEPNPRGKTIGRVIPVRLNVLEPRDPGPELLKPVPLISPAGKYVKKKHLNWLHVLTKEWIIRRELLLKEGDPYEQVIVDETARNMRSRMPVSLVVIVPVKSRVETPPASQQEGTPTPDAAPEGPPRNDPDKVDLLILVKDIWSLRLSFDIAVTPGGLESLVIVPQETNFLGLHHTAQTRFQLAPETVLLGVGYRIPRFGYSWVGASASASITINKRSATPEGSAIGLSVGQGLYSTRTDWAWDADVGYAVGVARRYSNARVFLFDSRATPGIRDNIPFQYKSRSFSASAGVTRSFGWGLKNNFSLTVNASTADYETFDLTPFNPAAVADFTRRAIPTSESRVFPSLSWRTFRTDFLRTLDINTLSLQEDYRLGHDVAVSLYPVFKSLGSSRDLVGLSAKAGYSVAVGDGLVGASVSTFAENADGLITDGSIGASFGAATPRFVIGRLVMNTSFGNRYRNYLNARAFLGGEDRLRGYPTNFFFGKDTVLYNIEFRSRPFLEILKTQIGGVLFFDAGDAAQGFDMLRAKQSVGFGLRSLVPQVNRVVFRADLAFPLKRGPFPETGSNQVVDPVGFFFSFDQAFAP